MTMYKALDFTRHLRSSLIKTVESFDLDTVNLVPANFNNNIIWNVAHLIASHEQVFYAMRGLATQMPAEMIARYNAGTKPEGPVSQAEIDHIKALATSTLDRIAEDVSNRAFDGMAPLDLGFTVLGNVDDLLAFLVMHEAMHYGNVASMKHVLPKAA